MTSIATLPLEKKFPVEAELAKRMRDLIGEYAGQISLVATLGVLELVKLELYKDA